MRILSTFVLLWFLPLVVLANQLQWDLLVVEDGVHSVTFETLRQYGFEPTAMDRLRLTNKGTEIPFWIDGDDGETFGPADRLVFLASHSPGKNSHYNTESPFNVYRLETGRPGLAGQNVVPGKGDGSGPAYIEQHLEQDRLQVRFNFLRMDADTEVWYWHRLNTLDRKPFSLDIDLGRIRPLAEHNPLSLQIGLRGWSTARGGQGMSDHQVDLLWNGEVLGSARWDGQSSTTLNIQDIPNHLLRNGRNNLQLRVPARRFGENADLLVDVSLLNWIKLRYPFDGVLDRGQIDLIPAHDGGVSLQSVPPGAMLYSRSGKRYSVGQERSVLVDEQSLMLVADAPIPVPAIRVNHPSNLADPDQQADYLMITHGSLKEAVQPLAEFHRSNGLRVKLIDVQDIYDEFSAGLVSADAIKAFISHAYHQWQKPAPRFVLLVGDASWDNHPGNADDRNYADWTAGMERGRWFAKNTSTEYAEVFSNRNLVPTIQAPTFEGFAASDSALVSVDGDDWYPDLAVGRIPVVTPGEVTAVVEKIISYAAQANRPAKWRRNLLLITNEVDRMQRKSDRLVENNRALGLAPTRVYPKESERDNRANLDALQSALNEGQLLVHFLGHGGRYIWRTGPPDLKKNHDLFTLDDIDRLAPSSQLPLVLSMTCYSAPFDHPTADSIGEKFLRAPERGAIGVLAASWRNSPSPKFSQGLVEELTRPDSTIGEAIMRAKRGSRQKVLVETYNLLGDPALRLVLPQRGMIASASRNGENGEIQLSVNLQELEGLEEAEIMLELLDGNDRVVAERTEHVKDAGLTLAWPHKDTHEMRQVRIYAWNDATGRDAIGATPITDVSPSNRTENPK